MLRKIIQNMFNTLPKDGKSYHPPSTIKTPIVKSLQHNLELIRKELGDSADITIRNFTIGQAIELHTAIIYADGLVNTTSIQDMILRPLMNKDNISFSLQNDAPQIAKDYFLTIGDISEVCDLQSLLSAVLSGDTVILFEGFDSGLKMDTRGWKERALEEPSTQNVIRGPKEGFSETLKTNIGLIRRRIKSSQLWVEVKPVGRITQTDVAILYIKGIAEDTVIKQVRDRLSAIDIDAIFESGNIEELIQDDAFSLFPTIYNTERPDVIAAGLVEGKVAIIVDGTPFVLLVPAIFSQFMQSPDDYYQRADIGTLTRILRLGSLLASLLAPASYIAITTYHQEMLPTDLLISIASSRSGVPFPIFLEGIFMESIFEILREAGLRMPKSIGQAISIVGALVLGQAAVDAGLVSPGMVIIVSLTAITNFVIPSLSMSVPVRILRFSLMILAALFGLFGIFVGIAYIGLHLCTLSSFGVPYLKPNAPFNWSDQKDSLWLRIPLWGMLTRQKSISSQNNVRQSTNPSQDTEDSK